MLLYETLDDRRIEGNLLTQTALMQASTKGFLWEAALDIFERSQIDLMAISAAMDATVKALQWSWVLFLFGSSGDGLGLDVVMDVCGKKNQWLKALSFFSIQTLPSLLSCTAAMNACEKTHPSRLLGISCQLSLTCLSFLQRLKDRQQKVVNVGIGLVRY